MTMNQLYRRDMRVSEYENTEKFTPNRAERRAAMHNKKKIDKRNKQQPLDKYFQSTDE